MSEAAPHKCPQCGEPAYLGFNMPAKCVQKGCLFYDQDLWVQHVMILPDPGDPEEDIEDADTEPAPSLKSMLERAGYLTARD